MHSSIICISLYSPAFDRDYHMFTIIIKVRCVFGDGRPKKDPEFPLLFCDQDILEWNLLIIIRPPLSISVVILLGAGGIAQVITQRS